MARFLFLFFLFISRIFLGYTQNSTRVIGQVFCNTSKATLKQVSIQIHTQKTQTNNNGHFSITTNSKIKKGVLILKKTGYITKKMPLYLIKDTLNLQKIPLDKAIADKDQYIDLSAADFNTSAGVDFLNTSVLHANRDLFKSRAAFAFNSAFFQEKGMHYSKNRVFINGMPLQDVVENQVNWNSFSGSNPLMIQQQYSALAFSPLYSSTLGNSIFQEIKPEQKSKKTQLTSSYSAKNYNYRIMASYHSGLQKNKIAYSLVGSKRWGDKLPVTERFYDAYALSGSMSYVFSKKHTSNITAFFTPVTRSGASALTLQEKKLLGANYNPNWGMQNGRVRRTKITRIKEPICIINHDFKTDTWQWNNALLYRTGYKKIDRIAHQNAPNPMANYYKNLPNYYLNQQDTTQALLAKDRLLKNRQISWDTFTKNNQEHLHTGAKYMVYQDVKNTSSLAFLSTITASVLKKATLYGAIGMQKENNTYFAIITDLLGARFYQDKDAFTNTNNDVFGKEKKTEKDKVHYHYKNIATKYHGYIQLVYPYGNKKFIVSGSLEQKNYQRIGFFQNQRYSNAKGKSPKKTYTGYALKASWVYKPIEKHHITWSIQSQNITPTFSQVFTNARENQNTTTIKNLEQNLASTLVYQYHTPMLRAKLTAYAMQIKNARKNRFYFLESGIGTAFVQENSSQLQSQNIGLELSLQHPISTDIEASFVAAIGQHTYSDNAKSAINFVVTPENPYPAINNAGVKDLGTSYINKYYVGNGPQQAYSLGLSYRNPRYWWVATTCNYLRENYISPATVLRTTSFFQNPEDPDGYIFDAISHKKARALLKQERIPDVFTINLTAGKSWKKKNTYINTFLSLTNLMGNTFISNGYESSRTANYLARAQDVKNNTPNFGSKYYYTLGRNFFLNLTIRW